MRIEGGIEYYETINTYVLRCKHRHDHNLWKYVDGNADIDDLFNPFAIHELFNVNWFGTFAILVFDIIFMTPLAIVYFIYKLCTIGRKDD